MSGRERERPNVRRWGDGGGDGGLPDIEALTDTSGRGPAEAFHAARAELGLEPPQHHDDDRPDVSGWREQMGLS